MNRLFSTSFILSCLAALPVNAQLDTNDNGMSDVWERQFNGGQLFPTGFLAENDDDGDGQNNLKESYSGTNPLHFEPPEGHFVQNLRHIQAVWLNEPEEEPILVTPEAFEVDWQSVVGKVYQLKSSQNLEPESWTAVCAPVIGDGQTITFASLPTIIGGQPADKLFWRVAVTDIDSDSDGLFDYEEHVLGLNPDNPQTFPGIDDLWLATNFPDDPNTFEPDDDADDDGLTNRQEHLYGTNPNIADIIGPVNLTFDDTITDFPDLSFREENPADLYDQTSVPGWNANEGQHIEIWDEGDGNKYVELQAHLGAHGIKQEFDMLPGTRLTFVLRYKGRYYWDAYENAFDLKVEGAEEVLINGTAAQASGNTMSHSFMEDDESDLYAEWHYASISITAPPGTGGLMPIILSLVPQTTTTYEENNITYGGFVDILPVEITAVFGIGPGLPGVKNSRELLEEYLETIKIARKGDLWVMPGEDENAVARLYVVEVADTEEKLLQALATKGRTVIFDGHANFGLGPNFSVSTFKTVENFTNFGVNQTDIPQSFRGDGNEPDPMPFYRPEWLQINTGDEDLDYKLAIGRDALNTEGWAYLVLQPGQVAGDVMNYTIPHIGGLRYVNDQGKGHGDEFAKQGVGFNNEWHFTQGGEDKKRLVVSAPNTQVPYLRYKTFFYNACDTGMHFIENFEHGTFVYTKSFCKVEAATQIFVQGLLEAKTMDEIMTLLNDPDVHGREDFPVIYEYEDDF